MTSASASDQSPCFSDTVATEASFRAWTSRDLAYFDQAQQINQDGGTEEIRALAKQRGRLLRESLAELGRWLCAKLSPLRHDLSLYCPTYQGRSLPERLWIGLHREGKDPKHEAMLYIALREEGAEIGFGFPQRRRQNSQGPIEQKFFRQVRRFHRKSSTYLQALQQQEYRLWSAPHRPFSQSSVERERWQIEGGLIVRLLRRDQLLASAHALPGAFTQLFSELLGLYAFLDRVYTAQPHIRPLHLSAPESGAWLPPEDDETNVQQAASESILDFISFSRAKGFDFSSDLVRSYYLSLQTRPFVILTGVAGTGKSKLAQLFATFLMEDSHDREGNPHIAFVPVRPDWLDPQGLLGYYDTLAGLYRPTPLLRLLLRAHADPNSPYFVILDEMNLARVEHYLSDFLSLLESRRYDANAQIVDQGHLFLHAEAEAVEVVDPWMGVLPLPGKLALPPNLYITGTVNLDESTHRLSPKVLDRANVIELSPPSPMAYLSQLYDTRATDFVRAPSEIARQRVAFTHQNRFTAPFTASQRTLLPEQLAQISVFLETLAALLDTAGFALGRRFLHEWLDFIEHHHRLSPQYADDETHLLWAFDHQLLQKVLPRLHGTRQRLGPLCQKLLLLCWPRWQQPEQRKYLLQEEHAESEIVCYRGAALGQQQDLLPPVLPGSARKLAQMLTELDYESYIDFHIQR